MKDLLLRILFPRRGGYTDIGVLPYGRYHECPGKCGRDVPNRRFCCETCWSFLPADVRFELNYGDRRRGREMARVVFS